LVDFEQMTWFILEKFNFQESSYQHLLINKKKTAPFKADLTDRLIKFYQPRLEVESLVLSDSEALLRFFLVLLPAFYTNVT
jgi:hypothetical protein